MSLPEPTKERGNFLLHLYSCAHSRLLYEHPTFEPMREWVMVKEVEASAIQFIDLRLSETILDDDVDKMGSATAPKLKQSFIKLFEGFLLDEPYPPKDMEVELPQVVLEIVLDTMILLMAVYNSFKNGLKKGMDLRFEMPSDEARDKMAKSAHLN